MTPGTPCQLTVGTLKKGLRGFIKKAGRKSKSDVGGASVSHSESRDDITPDDSVISEKGEDSDSDTGSLYDVVRRAVVMTRPHDVQTLRVLC